MLKNEGMTTIEKYKEKFTMRNLQSIRCKEEYKKRIRNILIGECEINIYY